MSPVSAENLFKTRPIEDTTQKICINKDIRMSNTHQLG